MSDQQTPSDGRRAVVAAGDFTVRGGSGSAGGGGLGAEPSATRRALEARVPFVDHELVEFVVNMPFHHKMRWRSQVAKARSLFHTSFRASERLDINKYMLRTIGADMLPREISNRKKLGFPTPLDNWLGSDMSDFARDTLLDQTARQRGMFDTGKLESLLASPRNLPYDFTGKRIWMLMNLELWFREVITPSHRTNNATSRPEHRVASP